MFSHNSNRETRVRSDQELETDQNSRIISQKYGCSFHAFARRMYNFAIVFIHRGATPCMHAATRIFRLKLVLFENLNEKCETHSGRRKNAIACVSRCMLYAYRRMSVVSHCSLLIGWLPPAFEMKTFCTHYSFPETKALGGDVCCADARTQFLREQLSIVIYMH